MKLSQIATIIPLVIVAIGLIGWILTVRNDVTGAVHQVDGIHEDISGIQERLEGTRESAVTIEQELHEQIMELEKSLHEQITELDKSLSIANDQMQTIMGDHMGFADVLKELGEAGALPTGERRAYGGYGN
jgi:hypothetical protein